MNSVVSLSENIRTIAYDNLIRNVSLARMHNSLNELFMDRTAIDTSFRRYFNEDSIRKVLKCSHCLSLNDKRTIKFHNSCKQDSYVFDESRQIWYDSHINPVTDDLFIPRDDAQ